MIMVVFWSLWGVSFLLYALIKQKQKKKYLDKIDQLKKQVHRYELIEITKEKANKSSSDGFVIPVYEDFSKNIKLQEEIGELKEYVEKNQNEFKNC